MTYTTKHTPGPWVAHHSGIGDATVVAECGWVNKDGTPFNPTIVSRIDWPTAHLIAAAPAMYADGKVLCGLVRDFMNDNRLYDGQVIQAIHNLETALAQAEARS